MRNTEQLVITKEYIHAHKTRRGAWTKVQVEALGLEWPPRQGWINDLIGTMLTPDKAYLFESGKNTKAGNKKENYWDLGKAIIKNVDKLTDSQIIRLYEFIQKELVKRNINKR